jgi:hypothetical protein
LLKRGRNIGARVGSRRANRLATIRAYVRRVRQANRAATRRAGEPADLDNGVEHHNCNHSLRSHGSLDLVEVTLCGSALD